MQLWNTALTAEDVFDVAEAPLSRTYSADGSSVPKLLMHLQPSEPDYEVQMWRDLTDYGNAVYFTGRAPIVQCPAPLVTFTPGARTTHSPLPVLRKCPSVHVSSCGAGCTMEFLDRASNESSFAAVPEFGMPTTAFSFLFWMKQQAQAVSNVSTVFSFGGQGGPVLVIQALPKGVRGQCAGVASSSRVLCLRLYHAWWVCSAVHRHP